MTIRAKKALLAAVGALAVTAASAVGPWVIAAEAVVPFGTATGAGSATQNAAPGLTPTAIDRFVSFTATGAFTIPPAAAAEVTMDCFIRTTGLETLASGSGANYGLAYCEAADGTSVYIGSQSGTYTRVGTELVLTSPNGGLWVRNEAFRPAAVHLVLTLVPTSGTLRNYAVVATLVVAPRETTA
ncbi:MAG: hypothetical protein M3394_09330 [Actinomycetota bacterium]|nr:hypothetical protein [Actinomycetota bacterium]